MAHGPIYACVVGGSFLLLILLTWYLSSSAPVIVSPTPAPPPSTASGCTMANSSIFSSGGITDEFTIHVTRCGVRRDLVIAGWGALDTAAPIDFPADSIVAGDLPYMDSVQTYTTRLCSLSMAIVGVDLQVFLWIFPDGSLSILSSLVSSDLDPPAVGGVFTDIVNGFPTEYAAGDPALLVCDMSWTSATAAVASAGVSAAGKFGAAGRPSPLAMASLKGRLFNRTLPVPPPRHRVQRSPTATRPPSRRP